MAALFGPVAAMSAIEKWRLEKEKVEASADVEGSPPEWAGWRP
jgi:hypothetical protein